MYKQQQNFIGIDISKLWFDASLLVIKSGVKQAIQTEQFDNNSSGLKAFDTWLKKFKVAFDSSSLVVIENTGIYHRNLWTYCTTKHLPLYIGNAADIKWSFGITRGKNDKIDSIRLCNYAHKHFDDIKPTPQLDKNILLLKDLMTARTKVLNQKNSIKTYLSELRQVNDKSVQKLMEQAHKAAISGLDKSLKNIEEQIQKILKDNPAILNNYKLLKTVPGIGHLNAVYLICCTNNFTLKISGKQLACYAGVVPFEHSSGSSIKGKHRVHRMANKDLKRLLHLSAMAAIQYYPEFKTYFERKVAEGKNKMSVLNAIRNKIVLRAVAVINNQQPYVDYTKMIA